MSLLTAYSAHLIQPACRVSHSATSASAARRALAISVPTRRRRSKASRAKISGSSSMCALLCIPVYLVEGFSRLSRERLQQHAYALSVDRCDVHVDVQKEEEQRRVERQQKQQQERLARLSVTTSPTSASALALAPEPPAALGEKPTMRSKQNGAAGTNVTVSATITLDAQDEPDAGSAAHPNSSVAFVCPPHHSSLIAANVLVLYEHTLILCTNFEWDKLSIISLYIRANETRRRASLLTTLSSNM